MRARSTLGGLSFCISSKKGFHQLCSYVAGPSSLLEHPVPGQVVQLDLGPVEKVPGLQPEEGAGEAGPSLTVLRVPSTLPGDSSR